MKEQTHLLPEAVNKLKETLGIKFKDTVDVWLCELIDGTPLPYKRIQKRAPEMYPVSEMETETTIHIPAPNLQEVLREIPSYLIIDNRTITLVPRYNWTTHQWYYEYRDTNYNIFFSSKMCYNPLDAALETLVWGMMKYKESGK